MNPYAAKPRAFDGASLGSVPIRDLGLHFEETRLAPLAQALLRELAERKVDGVQPRFYFSTEWGVAFGTIAIAIAIAIPFYLARPELEALHAVRNGHVEGQGAADILRYLRHEMGHVVSYAHRLYALEEWTRAFGAITQPYIEEYKPLPFDRRYVNHLPGWYAQKHPDEDWAETFAIWLTPGSNWRKEHSDRPDALAKLELCERLMAEYGQRPASISNDVLDEDVSELSDSLDAYYVEPAHTELFPNALDGALLAIFSRAPPASPSASFAPAANLLRELARPLMAEVYRWTGHFPERTRRLLKHLEERAHALDLRYEPAQDREARLAIATLVTALAMNHVHKGSYAP